MIDRKTNVHQSTIILGLVTGLLILSLITKEVAFVYIGLFFSLFSALSEKIGNLFAKIWMLLGNLMSYVVGVPLLFVLYIFILTPLALLKRSFSAKKKTDLWYNRRHYFSKESFLRPW
ncbi:MAG: hypothetical protein HWE07_01545 [Cytophagia bacterium]|nr:hypothetical protein [Cytophagia bacterium]